MSNLFASSVWNFIWVDSRLLGFAFFFFFLLFLLKMWGVCTHAQIMYLYMLVQRSEEGIRHPAPLLLLYFLKTRSLTELETHHWLDWLASKSQWLSCLDPQGRSCRLRPLCLVSPWCCLNCSLTQFCVLSSEPCGPFPGFYLGQLNSFLFFCVFLTMFPHRCLLVLHFSPHLSGIIFRSFFFSELFPHVICVSKVAHSAFLMFCSLWVFWLSWFCLQQRCKYDLSSSLQLWEALLQHSLPWHTQSCY